jgi:hypothetical protein
MVFDVVDLGLAESALHAPAATSGEVEAWIRRQTH